MFQAEFMGRLGSQKGIMGRRPRIDRIPEEKRQIVQEGIKGGMEGRSGGGSKGSAKGESAATGETENDQRIRQLERTLDENLSRLKS